MRSVIRGVGGAIAQETNDASMEDSCYVGDTEIAAHDGRISGLFELH
jgi:hypothetical protein